MSDDPCTWPVSCKTYDCKKSGKCVTTQVSEGPNGNSHDINTDYHIVVAGIIVPLVRTVRKFKVTYSKVFGQPSNIKYFPSTDGGGFLPAECTPRPATRISLAVKDDCVIEKSTLHYLDQRYGVCLYRYQKDELHLTVTSSEIAKIKEPWRIGEYYQAQVKTDTYTAQRREEWRLITGGVEKVLASTVTALEPFGPRNDGKPNPYIPLFPDYAPDRETRMVLLFPTPPSMGIPWSDVICRLGAYEFGYDTAEGAESPQNMLDGGEKDHFYPQWCRNLQQDPFWRAAADSRYQISWWKNSTTQAMAYTPPPLTVDPFPRGSYVKHPVVGEVYQFLVGNNVLATSPDLTAIIVKALPDGVKTHDTTLYYPISLA